MANTNPTPNVADVRYVIDSYDVVQDWLRASQEDPFIPPAVYWDCVAKQAALVARIMDGDRVSPWHDDVPEDYIAVIAALGGRT